MTFVSVLLISCLSAAQPMESSQGCSDIKIPILNFGFSILNSTFKIQHSKSTLTVVNTAEKWVYKQKTDPSYRSSILHYMYLQNEEYPTMNSKNKDNRGVLHRWIIPSIITISVGAVVLTLYSVRGR